MLIGNWRAQRDSIRWRLSLAADLLRRPHARVSEVARQVGYESDAAFSRAFKAQFGVAPVRAGSLFPKG